MDIAFHVAASSFALALLAVQCFLLFCICNSCWLLLSVKFLLVLLLVSGECASLQSLVVCLMFLDACCMLAVFRLVFVFLPFASDQAAKEKFAEYVAAS